MARDVYFTEDQRWPSRSQRFGWAVAPGVVIFILFQLNVHLFQPVIAGGIILVLVLVLLAVITVQQRLTVRIGLERSSWPLGPVVDRLRRRGANEDDAETPADSSDLVLTIVHIYRSPVSALSPGRRGSRLGRRERRIAFDDIESWSAARLSTPTLLRGGPSTFPVGMHRDAVAIVLAGGERLLLPTQTQAAFLQALSLAKVDSLKRDKPRVYTREEL